jgi:hypothetical protein
MSAAQAVTQLHPTPGSIPEKMTRRTCAGEKNTRSTILESSSSVAGSISQQRWRDVATLEFVVSTESHGIVLTAAIPSACRNKSKYLLTSYRSSL